MNETQNNYGYEPIAEQLADLIKANLPADLAITDFAKAVAYIVADEYGEGMYGQFLLTLKENLINLK
jgi:hypothetical protein